VSVAGAKGWGAPRSYWDEAAAKKVRGSRRSPKWYDGPFTASDEGGLRVAVEGAAAVAKALDPFLHGTTRDTVAKAAGVSATTVGDLVAGRLWPGLDSVLLVADALELRLWVVPERNA
jgi:hypothetical protein